MDNEIKGPPGVGVRRCGPVFGPDGAGIVDEIDGDDFWCITSEGHYDAYVVGELCLGLTDPTGFMHGVWALAERHGITDLSSVRMSIMWVIGHGPTATLEEGPDALDICVQFDSAGVPALAEIDPEDPQRDAKVLAVLMRHMFANL